MPFITSAAYLSSGSIGNALIYPIVVPAVCFIICLFIMPETRHISIGSLRRPEPLARSFQSPRAGPATTDGPARQPTSRLWPKGGPVWARVLPATTHN